jgi:hypothetical protein
LRTQKRTRLHTEVAKKPTPELTRSGTGRSGKLRSDKAIPRARWRLLAAGVLLAFLFALPAAAQGKSAVVRSDPAALEVNVGQVVTLNIVLADAQKAYGIDVRATFDPQLVEVVDADPGKEGIQMTPGAFLRPDFVARNVVDNTAGTLRYALTQVNPTQPASGTGVIFIVQFRGKTPGETTLTLGPVEMADRQGQTLPVTIQSGTIRVITAESLAAVPAPTQPGSVPATVGPTPLVASAEPAETTPTSVPASAPRTSGGLPCAGGALPALGLLGLAGWGALRRDR